MAELYSGAIDAALANVSNVSSELVPPTHSEQQNMSPAINKLPDELTTDILRLSVPYGPARDERRGALMMVQRRWYRQIATCSTFWTELQVTDSSDLTMLKLERSKNAIIEVDCRLPYRQTSLGHAENFLSAVLLQHHRIRTLEVSVKDISRLLHPFTGAAAPALETITLEEHGTPRLINLKPMPRLRIVELRGVKLENWTVLRNLKSLSLVNVGDPTFESSFLQVLAASPLLEVLSLEHIWANEAAPETEPTSPLLIPSLSKLTAIDIRLSTTLLLQRNIQPEKMQHMYIYEGRLSIADQLLTKLSESRGSSRSPLAQAFFEFGIDHIALEVASPVFRIKASSRSATRIILELCLGDEAFLRLAPSLPFTDPTFPHQICFNYEKPFQSISPSEILDVIPNISDLEFEYVASDWLAVCQSLGEPLGDGGAWRCSKLKTIKICGGYAVEFDDTSWTVMTKTLAGAVKSRKENSAVRLPHIKVYDHQNEEIEDIEHFPEPGPRTSLF